MNSAAELKTALAIRPGKPAIIDGIEIIESEAEPNLVQISEADGFFLNPRVANDFRVRATIYERLKHARAALPQGYAFMVFEGFRPRSRQLVLWDNVMTRLRTEYPELDGDALSELATRWVSSPHGFGSGHQAGAAVDITLCTDRGDELFMGTAVQEFGPLTATEAPGLDPQVKARRFMLRRALEANGVVNYPDEWWHFSYGDRLWAEVTGRNSAFFAPIA